MIEKNLTKKIFVVANEYSKNNIPVDTDNPDNSFSSVFLQTLRTVN